MDTPSTYPPHLACLRCDPSPEFYTFWDLTAHYYKTHPLVMDPTLCTCGHSQSTHNPAPTRSYCQSADTTGQCRCRSYERQAAA